MTLEDLGLTGIKQTILGRGPEFNEPPGNCMQAALATVLGVPLQDVPHFLDGTWGAGDPLTGWWEAMNVWLLEQFGTALMGLRSGDWQVPAVAHLIQGRTVRGSSHVVVGYAGQVIFDPHPSDAGLETLETHELFVASPNRRGVRDTG